MLKSIYIPELLKRKDRKQEIFIDDNLPDLETLTPVRGRMLVYHRTTYLEVTVQAETIITLTCDRCLSQYNHQLTLDTSEMIWLQDDNTFDEFGEKAVHKDDLSERLSSLGNFYPEEWLYQQLSLAYPLQQLCNNNCEVPLPKTDTQETSPKIDSRWSSLASLKQQLEKNPS